MQNFILPSSCCVVVTGQVNNGKTYQIARLLRARAPDGSDACLPAVVFRAESSSEGTMGDLLADDERVLSWPAPTSDDAIAGTKIVCPEGRPPLAFGAARLALWECLKAAAVEAKRDPPPKPERGPFDDLPVRGLAYESLSKMHDGQLNRVRDDFNAARGKGAGRQSVSGKDQENNNMRISGLAAGRSQVLVDHINSAGRHRGMLVCCAVHTRAATESVVLGEGPSAEKFERVVGEAPNFGAPKSVGRGLYATGYAALWNSLHACANVVAHAYATTPDFTASPLDDINDPSPEHEVKHGLVCTRGTYPGLGYVGWPKRQDGDSWLNSFAYAPRLWHPDVPWAGREAFVEFARTLPSGKDYEGGPDLGLLLEACLKAAASR